MCVPAYLLLAEFEANAALRSVLLRYTQSYVAQLAQNVPCTRRHKLSSRLARWLLEMCDLRWRRVKGDARRHRADAQLPSRRCYRRARPAARTAAHPRQASLVQILDVKGLEAASCECYAVLQREYDRLLGKKGAEFDGNYVVRPRQSEIEESFSSKRSTPGGP